MKYDDYLMVQNEINNKDVYKRQIYRFIGTVS